jgi:hypothetical protein
MPYLNDKWTEAQLIVRADGAPITEDARADLARSGAYEDHGVGGFVVEAGGMPVSYFVLLPLHNLVVLPVSVPYNPGWFSKPSPAPVFESLPAAFTGFPHGNSELAAYWFVRSGMKPFMATWCDNEWRSSGQCFSPEQTVREGWIVLATISEAVQMNYVRIDEANLRRASHAELEAISLNKDGESALRVGVATGRIAPLKLH